MRPSYTLCSVATLCSAILLVSFASCILLLQNAHAVAIPVPEAAPAIAFAAGLAPRALNAEELTGDELTADESYAEEFNAEEFDADELTADDLVADAARAPARRAAPAARRAPARKAAAPARRPAARAAKRPAAKRPTARGAKRSAPKSRPKAGKRTVGKGKARPKARGPARKGKAPKTGKRAVAKGKARPKARGPARKGKAPKGGKRVVGKGKARPKARGPARKGKAPKTGKRVVGKGPKGEGRRGKASKTGKRVVGKVPKGKGTRSKATQPKGKGTTRLGSSKAPKSNKTPDTTVCLVRRAGGGGCGPPPATAPAATPADAPAAAPAPAPAPAENYPTIHTPKSGGKFKTVSRVRVHDPVPPASSAGGHFHEQAFKRTNPTMAAAAEEQKPFRANPIAAEAAATAREMQRGKDKNLPTDGTSQLKAAQRRRNHRETTAVAAEVGNARRVGIPVPEGLTAEEAARQRMKFSPVAAEAASRATTNGLLRSNYIMEDATGQRYRMGRLPDRGDGFAYTPVNPDNHPRPGQARTFVYDDKGPLKNLDAAAPIPEVVPGSRNGAMPQLPPHPVANEAAQAARERNARINPEGGQPQTDAASTFVADEVDGDDFEADTLYDEDLVDGYDAEDVMADDVDADEMDADELEWDEAEANDFDVDELEVDEE
ncbi:hypothetical protein HDU96_001540 [Phlyctochytrium bullatum]|nr:hypothetical protein HDU96_001540 [Phlyctochytrium bullatum]